MDSCNSNHQFDINQISNYDEIKEKEKTLIEFLINNNKQQQAFNQNYKNEMNVKVNNSKQNRKRKPIKINENKIQNVVDEFVYDVKEEQDTCRSFNDRPNSPESDKMLSVDDDDDDDGNI
jgi:hypothetical protein